MPYDVSSYNTHIQLPALTTCQGGLRHRTKQFPGQWAVCVAGPDGLRFHLGRDGLPVPRYGVVLRGGRHVERQWYDEQAYFRAEEEHEVTR